MTGATQAKPADIGNMARQIQQQAATARHLAATVSQTLVEIDECEDCRSGRKEAEERALLFADLIERVADKIAAIALQVEEADFKRHFAAASAA